MFTDIADYSRLMEENEARTIALLKRHNDVVLPVIESAAGHVVDAIGDGLLVVFPSVRKAVECGVAIHRAIASHNSSAPESDEFRLRIGVHLGEVWHDGGRIYGNGVNVAARVQPHALPGGICITEDVYRQIQGRLDERITSIGVRELKNISRRIELYHVETGCEKRDAAPRTLDGELDAVKERVLSQLQRVGEKHESMQDGEDNSSLEQRIESKVYGLVEHVMDRALAKWDQMPEEKKLAIIRDAHSDLDREERKGGGDVEVNIGAGKRHHVTVKDKDSASSAPLGKLLFGAACGIGFGLGYFRFGIGWMVWLFVILGVLPFISGARDLARRSARRRQQRSERPVQLERRILEAARRLGGRTTVVQISAETDLPLDEVQEALDRMTAKGYVSQEILDSGVIRYDFPSLGGTEGA